jgi:hypothetical protein
MSSSTRNLRSSRTLTVTLPSSRRDRDLAWYLSRVEGIERRSEKNWLALCPAHSDMQPSLSVTERNGDVLVHCFAGCSYSEVIRALEAVEPHEPRASSATRPIIERGIVVARYDYYNADGELVYRKLRYEPKSFEFRRPVIVASKTEGPVQHSEYVNWRPGLRDREGNFVVEPIPYRLPEMLAANDVWIVDGEKDADRLTEEGVVATCSPYGMGSWRREWSEMLRVKRVTIVRDRDECGRSAAAAVKAQLGTVRVMEAAEGKDASDHLDAGYGLADFVEVSA